MSYSSILPSGPGGEIRREAGTIMRLDWRGYGIEIRNEPTYSLGSADNLRPYSHEVALDSADGGSASRHGLAVKLEDQEVASCIVLAKGGPTSVHERSAIIIVDRLFLAIGNQVCAFSLPSLDLVWHVETDLATCFGVVAVPDQQGLISHGEIEIGRLTLDGSVVWRQSGRDIFTGTLTLHRTWVHVTDWNGDTYRFDLATGHREHSP